MPSTLSNRKLLTMRSIFSLLILGVLEAVIAMLACARLGAVHSVVFGGFAAQELARRIEHAEVRELN